MIKRVATHVWEFLIAFSFVSAVVVLGPHVESVVYPVMKSKQTHISEAVQTGSYETNIYGSAVRRRDCTFISLKWYYGKRGERAVSVTHKFLGPPKIRPQGIMEFGPWSLRLPPELITQSYADAYHQCSFLGIPFPWISKSGFYN